MENEAEHYYLYLRRLLGCKTQTQVANKIGVSQPSITGWLKRNSFELIRQHIINLGFDITEIDEKVKNNDFSTLKSNAFLVKEKFFLACKKYKIEDEDIATVANVPLELITTIKKEDIKTDALELDDELLAKCFLHKYNNFGKENITIKQSKKNEFAQLYFVTVAFPKPLFWLIWCCIGFFVLDKKIKAEEVEDFLDILIQNREDFDDDLVKIPSTEELIDTVLAKIEELLLKSTIDPIEEFLLTT